MPMSWSQISRHDRQYAADGGDASEEPEDQGADQVSHGCAIDAESQREIASRHSSSYSATKQAK